MVDAGPTAESPPARPALGPGIALALLSAVSFGLSGAVARGLFDAGWSAGTTVLVRTAIGAAVLVVPGALALRGRWSVLRRQAPMVILYGVLAVAGAQLCYFFAVTTLQVGVALLIEYLAPVGVVVWLWVVHGQRPGRLTVLGAAVAGVGLVLLLDVLSGAELSVPGLLWAAGAMVGAATYFVLSADVSTGMPPISLAAGGLVVGTIVLGAAGALGVLPMDASTDPVRYSPGTVPWWVPIAALGLVTAALAYVTGIAASRRLGPRLASFVALSEVVAAIVFARILLDQVPRPTQLLGAALVLAGVVVVKVGEPAVEDTPPEPQVL
jgi:drug/metabolite transporter (DMT)-like permease